MRSTYFSLSFLVLSYLLMPAMVYPQIDDLKWSRGPSGLYPVTKWDATAGVKRIGFIDNTGKLVIDYEPLHGYMDQKGKVVIEPRAVNKAEPFVGGLARVFVKGDEGSSDDYGYINKTGKFIWRYTK